MERDYAIAVLEREAHRVLDLVEEDGDRLAQAVPCCPGWSMEDLVKHLGNVYNWAGTIVADRRASPPSRDALAQRPANASYPEWMADRLDRLLRVLSEAPSDATVWTFASSESSPVAFWWRRQAHETLIHRVDAEIASDMAITPAEPSLAADNVDELFDILSFQRAGGAGEALDTEANPQPAEPGPAEPGTAGSPHSIHLHATDLAGAEWTIDTGSRSISRRHAKADVALKGPAWALARWCWGRPALDELEPFGDLEAGEAWRASIAR